MGGSAPRGGPIVNRPTLPVGAATGIGSLGLDDHAVACDFVFDHTPALPAAPSLPPVDSRESIIGQAAAGLDGVEIAEDGVLDVDTARLLANDPERAGSLDGPEFLGVRTFVDAALARRDATDGSPSRLKFQLTGPVTFGLALAGEGVPIDDAFPFAGSVVRARARAFAALFRSRIPDVTPVVFVDEPGLTSMTHPGFPLVPGDTVRQVASVLDTFDDGTLTGIHCCGSTDWSAVIAAGPDVLSTPLDCGLGFAGAELSRFLQEGGWVAWGAVPTDQPLGTTIDRYWQGLSAVWGRLAEAGCDPVLLRTQALVTPACGLAGYQASQAARVFQLVNTLADRLRSQAVGLRLQVGA